MIFDFQTYSENTAVLDEFGMSLTYSALSDAGRRVMEAAGRRCLVFILCQNEIGALVGYTGLLNGGAVPLLLNSRQDGEALAGLLRAYQPPFLWAPEDMLDAFPGMTPVYRAFGYALLRTGYETEYLLHLMMETTDQGVLLIDIAYGSLQQLLDNVAMGNEGYLYLANSDGELIYHQKIQLIDAGLAQENTQTIQKFQDGNEHETFQGKKRDVVVKSVGYTGWKLVGVTPEQGFSLNHLKTRLFMVFVAAFFLFLLALINSYISSRITAPIQELEKSVNALEEGALDTEVYIGGSYEIQHLGRSIGDMAKRIQTLMEDIVAEHESKRKSEFDTLQSQINPHFLYNTLDIIVWMVENEQKQEAVKVVTALARFFRISLSRGKSIIPVKDELEHVRNYLMIQQMRFKNKFVYQIEAEPEVLSLASLKLMLQPLVENAIYHGMEFMDGDGEIVVKAWRQEGNLRFTIADNGLGMTTEQAAGLLTGRTHGSSRRGSGIGVKNVNERIRLYFGEEYGLVIWSEPDEGTKVEICLPAVPFEKLAEEDKP